MFLTFKLIYAWGACGRKFESCRPDNQAVHFCTAFFIVMFLVYILFSDTLQKFYVGFTSDVQKRLLHHNSGQDRFSKKGRPWKIIRTFVCPDKSTALLLEAKIKARGAKRFLDDTQNNDDNSAP